MLAPWQTEWCPASGRIRRRLTELGIDFVTRRVPVDTDERTALRQAIRLRCDPALVLGNSRAAK